MGWFISPGIFIEFDKVFGRFSLGAHTAAAVVAPVYFPYLAYKEDPKYIGAEAVKNHKKKGWREWVDAVIFAIVAATLIRTFIFEAYTSPSGSMEKSLLINDFLFVSKLCYGPRIPNTPLSVPFVHNYLPFGSSRKSYSEAIKLPYMRWFESPVKRNDAVVFNFPEHNVPLMLPAGGHAVYLDAKEFLPHVAIENYPGQALACALYIEGGIRCVEIGSFMFGKYDSNQKLIPAALELVRLAIPRRVYTQSHMDYVCEMIIKTYENRAQWSGYTITEQPLFLRHFTAKLKPIN